MTLVAVIACLALAPSRAAENAQIPAEARAFFAQYKLLTEQFNSDLLELYAADADIQGWHKDSQSGRIAKVKYSAEQQREIFAQTAPKLKQMNAKAQFGTPQFKPEGKGVRINVEFTTVLPQGAIPGQVSLLVEPDAQEVWKIKQELTYSSQ